VKAAEAAKTAAVRAVEAENQQKIDELRQKLAVNVKKVEEKQQKSVDKAKGEHGRLQMQLVSVNAAKAAAEAALAPKPQRHGPPPASLWDKLASGIETKSKLHALFDSRQQNQRSTDPRLRILSSTKCDNDDLMRQFRSSGRFQLDPKNAHAQSCDTFLFHGAKDAVMPNIQSEGLKMRYAGSAHGVMLGNGVYGAPDPRKSLQYCSGQHGRFMFVCRFVLKKSGPSAAKFAMNSVYEEFCIFDDREVVVLWMIKVGQ
jgi:hypothetical protein